MKLLKRAQTALQRAQTAIEQRVSSSKHDESVLRQSNRWVTSITWGLIATTGFSISWLALAKTEEIVVAPGTLVPIGSVQEIQMQLGGIVSEILVKDGDRVKADQALIKLDTEASEQKLKSINENLELSQRQLELKQVELDRYTRLNEDSINTLTEKVLFEKQILVRYKSLSEVGASSELQYLQQRNTLQEVEGRLRETSLDGLRQQAILGQDIQRLKVGISTLHSELAEIKVTLRYQVLRSPVDGVVFDLQPKGLGYTAQASETLMKIVPFNALEAKVEIPSSDIGFVSSGMKVDLSIDSFPATDFGVLHGQVSQIGSDALPPEPAKQQTEYRYPAIISLKSQTLSLKNGKNLLLQPGMSLTANIKLRKVSYLQLLMGGFKDKTDSLRHH